ncbi:NO-binding membrane sensor protein with MHYT domain [Nocardia kruczakiae]|uniref:NO-binding membrane sensor protein with MHYT domain n=1 Tax=Nocardia kruczakiae TaxID=261477 RepID=A0ABU1XP51_9NOCA|nr:MHYT domain-containing protein [Nocardia kruczakiae]MDR7172299.1 NO-binding membrane sensor protein with MHYT domain [Nocardia kruczakiae]
MLQIDQFTYGWLTPTLAYIMSVIGSLLALRCMVRARANPGHRGWIVTAAVALGGTGVWVMHFIAMLGFSVRGATIRYNIPITLISAAIAVVVVWIGLSLVSRRQGDTSALLTGGAVTGLGVAAMHYAGMYAMKTDVAMHYDPWPVIVSIVIAVVAATAALWFALHVEGLPATIGSAMIMGVAVCGMHYTGMYAMQAHMTDHMQAPSGAQANELLTPLIIGVSMVTLLLFLQVGITDIHEPDLSRIRGQRASRYWPSSAESDPPAAEPFAREEHPADETHRHRR